jgi:hypothetical protein
MSEMVENGKQRLETEAESSGIKVPTLNLNGLFGTDFNLSRNVAVNILQQMDGLPKISETIQRGLSDMFSSKLAVQNSFNATASVLQSILEHERQIVHMNLMPLIDSRSILEGIFKSLQPALEATRISIARDLARMSRGLESVRQYFEQERETAEAFLYAGFCMAPSMSNTLIQRVVALRRENKKKRIAETIMRYYQNKSYARLKAMVVRWETNPLFSPRMQIIRDALQGHLSRQYTLSIPVLLTQAEGIAVDFLLHYEIPTKSLTNKQVFTDALNETTAVRMRFAVHESVTTFVDTILYAKKSFETLPIRSKERINRHAILHGRQVNYATERNSLRVLLLLDALSALTIELHDDKKPRTKRRALQGKPK